MEDAFTDIEVGKAKPTKRLRSDTGKPAKGGGKKGKGAPLCQRKAESLLTVLPVVSSEEKEEESFNPLDLLEATDVFGQLPGDWEEKVFGLPKWKDKKVILQ
jgi:hypothetical protein